MKIKIPRSRLPKVITFDAYNCLYSTVLPVIEQYCSVAANHSIEANSKVLKVKFPKVFKEANQLHPNYGKGTGLTPDEWWTLVITNLFKPVDVPKSMINEILRRFNEGDAYTVYPDVVEFLETIRSSYPHIVLGVISNSESVVFKLLERLDLMKYFHNNVYLSYDLGVSKPDKDIFNTVLDKITKKNPELLDGTSIEDLKTQCWHIGDEEENDMIGSSNAGWNGVLIDRTDRYGYLKPVGNRIEQEAQVYYAKIDNNSAESWDESRIQKTIVKVSDSRFVIPNFYMLNDILFAQDNKP
ncbi:HFL093Cp [Eremothecium sinecaudum]|uniref:HFL093Cp n=1 Tax=Eremothecium sinecaudum TaxID=45286 RepID=A0A109UZR4_9SACH|nr:HFL093Cp [Eremothecium sinecaudum]AMD21763.1 HFL093Cp [Eremothecium sinecaudum]